jgi:hypothetical protein
VEVPRTGGAVARLRTEWDDGEMRYRFEVAPATFPLKASASYKPLRQMHGFTVYLRDRERRTIIVLPLTFDELDRVRDSSGAWIALSADGNVPCSRSTYHELAEWLLSWNL